MGSWQQCLKVVIYLVRDVELHGNNVFSWFFSIYPIHFAWTWQQCLQGIPLHLSMHCQCGVRDQLVLWFHAYTVPAHLTTNYDIPVRLVNTAVYKGP